jgi:hypothetical protein
MYERNNYPIYEPVFLNWNNIGAEAEEKVISQKRDEGRDDTYIGWADRKEHLDLLLKDWYGWAYMEVRFATNTDEGRQCKWCRQKLVQYEVNTTSENRVVSTTLNLPEGMEINKFKKGDVVIREQQSKTGFETLHVDCTRKTCSNKRKYYKRRR